tara:strand:+ start:544 stop:1458 length:915 start_codon:yes stop_codon:yes gene_type:complete
MARGDGKMPLVSVVVITYNSSKYVLETLESIKGQTYSKIELVISDDCSTDETVSICREWIQDNKRRFVRTKIVEFHRNTGVAPNCNRGLHASSGEWLKIIAGDDLLLAEALDDFIAFVNESTKRLVVVSDLLFFHGKSGLFSVSPGNNEMSAESQLKDLLLVDASIVPSIGPSGFLNKNLMDLVGGFDESYPMIEDFPLSIRLLDHGFKIYALNKPCVKYRINKGSISTGSGFSQKFIEMYRICGIPVLRRRRMYLVLWHWKVREFINTRAHGIIRYSVFRYIIKMTSPYAWFIYLRKRKADFR